MRQCMDADNLHRRLKKIIGQVQAIDRMIDEDVPCEGVLLQINAAKSGYPRRALTRILKFENSKPVWNIYSEMIQILLRIACTRESGNICPSVTVLLAGRCSVPR